MHNAKPLLKHMFEQAQMTLQGLGLDLPRTGQRQGMDSS